MTARTILTRTKPDTAADSHSITRTGRKASQSRRGGRFLHLGYTQWHFESRSVKPIWSSKHSCNSSVEPRTAVLPHCFTSVIMIFLCCNIHYVLIFPVASKGTESTTHNARSSYRSGIRTLFDGDKVRVQ
jgi:hypothetical protein